MAGGLSSRQNWRVLNKKRTSSIQHSCFEMAGKFHACSVNFTHYQNPGSVKPNKNGLI